MADAEPQSAVLEVNAATRLFDEGKGLAGVSLRLAPGTIYGLLGPNGAGKTSFIRAVCGRLRLTEGSVRLDGADPTHDREARRTLFLELRRDHGALVMASLLPVGFFLVFAFIFAGTGGADLGIRLAVADTVADADTRTLVAAIAADPTLELVGAEDARDPECAGEPVRRGTADARLVILRAFRDAGVGGLLAAKALARRLEVL